MEEKHSCSDFIKVVRKIAASQKSVCTLSKSPITVLAGGLLSQADLLSRAFLCSDRPLGEHTVPVLVWLMLFSSKICTLLRARTVV